MLLLTISPRLFLHCSKIISKNQTLKSRFFQSTSFFQYQAARRFSSISNDLIFRQLFHGETFTYTYIVGCAQTRQAVIIDPVDDMADRDLKLSQEMKLSLTYGVNTHVHADHVTGTGLLKEKLPGLKSIISKSSNATADIYVSDGDTIKFGSQEMECRFTPGHTNGCMTYLLPNHCMAFTGDALLIRSCGRTDFQEGDAKTLYKSVHEKIFTLPDACSIYPGHDYNGYTVSTVFEERQFNPRLTLSEQKFVEFMRNLNLAYPKLIDKSIPANLKCGKVSKEALQGSEKILKQTFSS